MDGLPGLEEVFRQEFKNAEIQRCQVHVTMNVLAKVPRRVKPAVANDLHAIFYASSKKDEWISLRTTNIIERLNKEFKRRTKSMEIVAGERACYPLLAFISLKMEVHWKNFLLGKRTSNLPVLQTLAHPNFTQSC